MGNRRAIFGGCFYRVVYCYQICKKLKLLRPFISFLIFVAIIAILPIALTYTGNGHLLIQKFWVFFGFISALTLMTVMLILIIGQIKPELYAQTFLIVTTVKILLSLFFVLIFVTKMLIDRYVFMANFLYVYFLNMVFEIYSLLRNLRNQNSQ